MHHYASLVNLIKTCLTNWYASEQFTHNMISALVGWKRPVGMYASGSLLGFVSGCTAYADRADLRPTTVCIVVLQVICAIAAVANWIRECECYTSNYSIVFTFTMG